MQVDCRPGAGGTIASLEASEKTIEMTAASKAAVAGKMAHELQSFTLKALTRQVMAQLELRHTITEKDLLVRRPVTGSKTS